ncbi:MAG: DUF6036 family nucleotidyltransferase [Eubacteriales bacterium]|nr:DUF6036 family nucleotidyltransferase [Eubacteriales bacterium]
MKQMNKEAILDSLRKFDEELSLTFDDDKPYHCVIAGGSAMVLSGLSGRASTHDIDIILDDLPKAAMDIGMKYNINNAVKCYIYNFPDDFKSRLKQLDIPSSRIAFYVISPEDFVISKLLAGRPKDISDIESAKLLSIIDWTLLGNLVNDIKDYLLNDRITNEFLDLYKQYRERNEPENE